MTKNLPRLAFAAMLAAGIAAPVFAQSGDINVSGHDLRDVRTIAVETRDLDLNTASGRFALNSRISGAVAKACAFGGNWSVDPGCAGSAESAARAKARELIAMAGSGGTAGGAN